MDAKMERRHSGTWELGKMLRESDGGGALMLLALMAMTFGRTGARDAGGGDGVDTVSGGRGR